jgi:hypothetical protein
MCCWISGARCSMPITWVTRARVIPSLRAISAWLATSPDPGGPATRWPCGGVRPPGVSLVLWAVWDYHGVVARHVLLCRSAPGASGRRCCRFRRPPWGPRQFRPFVRGRPPQGRRCGHTGRYGRSGSRPRARPTPGGI